VSIVFNIYEHPYIDPTENSGQDLMVFTGVIKPS